MIEVTINIARLAAMSEMEMAASARNDLADAGIPLRPTLSLLDAPRVLHGKLEWMHDMLSETIRFRWHPENQEGVRA